jgi:hypothetical protein
MFDRQRIERAASEEALQQMPVGVMTVEAPSEEIVSVNRQAQEIFERYLGTSVPSELQGLRELGWLYPTPVPRQVRARDPVGFRT